MIGPTSLNVKGVPGWNGGNLWAYPGLDWSWQWTPVTCNSYNFGGAAYELPQFGATVQSANNGADTNLLVSSRAGSTGTMFATLHNTGTITEAMLLPHLKTS